MMDKDRILTLIKRKILQLSEYDISVDVPIISMNNIDSLKFVELIVAIEDEFGIVFDPEADGIVLAELTIEKISEIVIRKKNKEMYDAL